MTEAQKKAEYRELHREIVAATAGERNLIARMATVAALLHNRFVHFFWTGFYMVDPEKPHELVVGPYQGTLGCLRIPFGKGVCGQAAAARRSIIVDDVHDFPGHIACDINSQSEIVCPVFDPDGALIAVLDVDSDKRAQFTLEDKQGLEAILAAVFANVTP